MTTGSYVYSDKCSMISKTGIRMFSKSPINHCFGSSQLYVRVIASRHPSHYNNTKWSNHPLILQSRYIWLFGHGNLKSRVHINLTAVILLISQKSQKFLYKKDSYVVDYCISSCLQTFIRQNGKKHKLLNPTFLLPLIYIWPNIMKRH